MTDQDGPSRDPAAGKAAAGLGTPSLSQQQHHGAPGQADTASQDQQQQPEQQEGEEEEQANAPLTETIAEGLQHMEERRQQLHAMVSGAPTHLAVLDTCRAVFARHLQLLTVKS